MNSDLIIWLILGFIIIFILFFIFIWCMFSIIKMSHAINDLVDLEYKKFTFQKSGSGESPDGEEPLH